MRCSGSSTWGCGARRRSWASCWTECCRRPRRPWRQSFNLGAHMATLGLVEYKDASPEVRAVYDDIMATRRTDWINNFWKAIAHDPATLKRTWEDIKQVMAPGALDPLTKELVYLAVSVSNQCGYCIASHTAGARGKGMT